MPPAPEKKSTKLKFVFLLFAFAKLITLRLLFFSRIKFRLSLCKSLECFVISLAILLANNGGTAFPTNIHCFLLVPSKI